MYEVTRESTLNTEALQVGYDTDSSDENEADHGEQKETAGGSVYGTESSDDDDVSQGGSDESEGENADSEAETSRMTAITRSVSRRDCADKFGTASAQELRPTESQVLKLVQATPVIISSV